MKGYQDSRAAYERLADGETVLAPGQTETVAELITHQRMVPLPRTSAGSSRRWLPREDKP